jgi:hypothetical protein
MELPTPQAIREKAAEQFAWGIDFATRREREVDAAREDEALGMRLVEAALALAEGELLDWVAHLPAEMAPGDKLGRGLRVLPFLSGPLKLLDMEFAHASAGVVPQEAIRALLSGADSYDFEGVALTAKTVVMQYRRRALAA